MQSHRILCVFPRSTESFGTFDNAYPLLEMDAFMREQGPLLIRAVQISEQIWFGVQIIRGLCAHGGLRENRVGLG